MTLPLCGPSQNEFWLGPPGRIVKLIQPDEFYTNTLDNNPSLHTLLAGGNTVQHVAKVRRHYGLTFTARVEEDADQILSIFSGQFGPGPYFFIDPLWRNVLTSAVSSAGARLQSAAGFVASATGSVAYSTAVTPPLPRSGIAPGVIAWTGAVVNSLVSCNAVSANVLDSNSVPVVPGAAGLPVTAYWEARAASGTPSVSLQVYFNDINNAFISATTVATCVLNTTFTRFAGTVAAASIPANATDCGIRLLCNTAASPVIYFTKLGMSYYTATTATLPPWVLGYEVPQMLVSSGSPSNHSKASHRRTLALDLVEA